MTPLELNIKVNIYYSVITQAEESEKIISDIQKKMEEERKNEKIIFLSQ